MRTFVAQAETGIVYILNLLFVEAGEGVTPEEVRETLRKEVRAKFGTPHVWFEDEVRTIHDPLRGPNPDQELWKIVREQAKGLAAVMASAASGEKKEKTPNPPPQNRPLPPLRPPFGPEIP